MVVAFESHAAWWLLELLPGVPTTLSACLTSASISVTFLRRSSAGGSQLREPNLLQLPCLLLPARTARQGPKRPQLP